MIVRDVIKLLRIDEEITLYDADMNTWRTGRLTKEYLPPAYLDWEVVGIQIDMHITTPVLELDIKPKE